MRRRTRHGVEPPHLHATVTLCGSRDKTSHDVGRAEGKATAAETPVDTYSSGPYARAAVTAPDAKGVLDKPVESAGRAVSRVALALLALLIVALLQAGKPTFAAPSSASAADPAAVLSRAA
jgi:hypothetical protein